MPYIVEDVTPEVEEQVKLPSQREADHDSDVSETPICDEVGSVPEFDLDLISDPFSAPPETPVPPTERLLICAVLPT